MVLDPAACSLKDVLSLGSSLFRGWERMLEEDLHGTRRREKTPQQLAVVWGLVAHTHHVASEVLDLIQRDRVLVALPLARMAFECAITAHWVSQAPDAASAFFNEDLRQRRNHVETLRKSTSLGQFANGIAAQMVEDLDSNSSARRFDGICDDLAPGGADAYAHYRLASHLSHPTVLIADFYLEPHPTAGMALRAAPSEEPNAKSWAFITVSSLVWAGRAVDYLDQRSPRRSELRAAARDLGIQAELKLTPEAHVRMNRRRKPISP